MRTLTRSMAVRFAALATVAATWSCRDGEPSHPSGGVAARTVSAAAGEALPTHFHEAFDSAVLDPDWTVVPGTRVARYIDPDSPANEFSLSANPGHLRYGSGQMTHADGFLTGWQPVHAGSFRTPDGVFHSLQRDPGLEIRRRFGGDRWSMEAKVDYHMPNAPHLVGISSNEGLNQDARTHNLRVYFGDGDTGTLYVDVQRWADRRDCGRSGRQRTWCYSSTFSINVVERTGFEWSRLLASTVAGASHDFGNPAAADSSHWVKLERAGGVLSAQWSLDGSTWTVPLTVDLATRLDGRDQQLAISGSSFFQPLGSYADYDYITVAPTNRPPVAVCQDVEAAADASCHADASIDGGSYDPDGDPLGFEQTPAGPYGLGLWPVDLLVSDGVHAASCTGSVNVRDLTPPAIACPADVVAECTANLSAPVAVGAASATDNCSIASLTEVGPASYSLGTTPVPFAATDGSGNTSSCATTVQVVDTMPPSVAVGGGKRLWPPNHAMKTVGLLEDCAIALDDACRGTIDPATAGLQILSVTSDEAVDSTGDGNTAADVVLVDATHVRLRAERAGNGDGRVYAVTFSASDPDGNTANGVCSVTVPHHPNAAAVDSGAAYAVTP